MNSGIFCVIYLIVMFFTYIWRYLIFGVPSIAVNTGAPQEDVITTIMSFINWALFINYLLLILTAYYRGAKTNRKYIATFPLIGAFFDIILPFIPLVPTIMNILTLVIGVSNNKDRIVYVPTNSDNASQVQHEIINNN